MTEDQAPAHILQSKALFPVALRSPLGAVWLCRDLTIRGSLEKQGQRLLTREEQKVRDFILQELHSGATEYESVGAFTRTVQRELITIVNNSEYQKLMSFLMPLK